MLREEVYELDGKFVLMLADDEHDFDAVLIDAGEVAGLDVLEVDEDVV